MLSELRLMSKFSAKSLADSPANSTARSSLEQSKSIQSQEIQFLNLLDEREWPIFKALPNYSKIWQMQKDILEAIASGLSPETIIFCEHEKVLTKGRRSKAENILDSSVTTFEIERGGDVTLHHPGQLVIYPLLKLHGEIFSKGLHEYLRFCEEVVIEYLSSLGLDAGRYGPTGVWVKSRAAKAAAKSAHENSLENQLETGLENRETTSSPLVRKIASIGIGVRKWITYHGISLNISNDLSDFSALRPCDFDSNIMTSLQNEGLEVSVDQAAHEIMKIFKAKF